jgi:hypothetical protein
MKQQGQSVEAYYSRVTGPSNFRRVIGPAINGVLSQTANEFPADLLFKKRRRRKDILKKFSFHGGLQAIAKAIAVPTNPKPCTQTTGRFASRPFLLRFRDRSAKV